MEWNAPFFVDMMMVKRARASQHLLQIIFLRYLDDLKGMFVKGEGFSGAHGLRISMTSFVQTSQTFSCS